MNTGFSIATESGSLESSGLGLGERKSDLRQKIELVHAASRELLAMSAVDRSLALRTFGDLMHERRDDILQANRRDLAENPHLAAALLQRLELPEKKLEGLIRDVHAIADFADPVNRRIEHMELAPGIVREKITVPLGVIAVIFESRPDVLPQVLSLMLRSGNAVVFKPGSESKHSVAAFMDIVRELGDRLPAFPKNWAHSLSGRDQVDEILGFKDLIQLIIPRGSNALVQSIQQRTKIPVLGHADGVCHTYVHRDADLDQAVNVILDAKCNYPSACNATETVLVHQQVVEQFLDQLLPQLGSKNCRVLGCDKTRLQYPEIPAVENWHTEYSDLILAIKIVDSIEEAVAHINRHGSQHTDAILCDPRNQPAADYFTNRVDSADVFINLSTRFADGSRFGYGAEIGISTGKIHARGPCGIEALLTTKQIVRGNGDTVKEFGTGERTFTHQEL